MPIDMAREIAKNKADAESKQTNQPIAVIEEGGEFKTKNAYAAYAAGDVVRDIVSAYTGVAAK
jgi:hypothetical protein